jgi:hypothetical protein
MLQTDHLKEFDSMSFHSIIRKHKQIANGRPYAGQVDPQRHVRRQL